MTDNNKPTVHIAEGALNTLETAAETHRSTVQGLQSSLGDLTGRASVFGDCASGQALSQAFSARAQGGQDSWSGVLEDAQSQLDEILGVIRLGHRAITNQDIEAAQAVTRSVA